MRRAALIASCLLAAAPLPTSASTYDPGAPLNVDQDLVLAVSDLFEFESIDISDGARLSFSGTPSTGSIQLLSATSVAVNGIIDATGYALVIAPATRIAINGSIFADSVEIRGGDEVFLGDGAVFAVSGGVFVAGADAIETLTPPGGTGLTVVGGGVGVSISPGSGLSVSTGDGSQGLLVSSGAGEVLLTVSGISSVPLPAGWLLLAPALMLLVAHPVYYGGPPRSARRGR